MIELIIDTKTQKAYLREDGNNSILYEITDGYTSTFDADATSIRDGMPSSNLTAKENQIRTRFEGSEITVATWYGPATYEMKNTLSKDYTSTFPTAFYAGPSRIPSLSTVPVTLPSSEIQSEPKGIRVETITDYQPPPSLEQLGEPAAYYQLADEPPTPAQAQTDLDTDTTLDTIIATLEPVEVE